MIDFEIMLKALKLTWIPRLLRTSDNSNWCITPKHYFRQMGGLNSLLRCNYDTNYFNDLPLFYKKILEFFNELKTLYSYDQKQELRGEKLNYNSCTSLLLRKSQNLLFLAPEVQWALKVYRVCSIHFSFKCFESCLYLACHVTTVENV